MANRSKKKKIRPKAVVLPLASSGAESISQSLFFKPRFDVWIALLLAAITFLVYWPSLKSDLVYDARNEILEEGFITSPSNLPDVFSLKVLGMNLMLGDRPGQLLYMMLIAAISGKDPLGYHLGSNLLHAVNVALLYLSMRLLIASEITETDQGKILGIRLAAVAATLLFALHPIAVESVSEVSYSSTLLVMLFFLIALLAATAFRPQDLRTAWLTGVLGTVCAFAAVASKESGITVALVLIVYRFLFRAHDEAKPWAWFLGAATVVTAAFLAARFLLAPPAQNVYHYLGGSFSSVFWIQPRVWVFMMSKILWPANLSADYTPQNISGISTPIALVVLAGVVALQAWLARKSPIGALGVATYWLGLVTVSNFVPLYRFTADRFYYVSLAGVALQVFALLMLLRSQVGFRIAVTSAYLALLPLLILTLKREAIFSNEFVLWTETIRVSPFSEIAHTGLGTEFRNRGRMDDAMKQYQLAPNYFLAQNNLANIFYESGKWDEAIKHYQTAIDLNPNYAKAHDNLGMALEKKGQIENAIVQFKKTIELDPNYVDAHTNLAIVLWHIHQTSEAMAEFEKAARLQPDDAGAQKNLDMARKAMIQK